MTSHSDDEASCCSLQDHDGDCKKKRMRKKRRRKNDLTVEMSPAEIDNRTSSQSSSDSYGLVCLFRKKKLFS